MNFLNDRRIPPKWRGRFGALSNLDIEQLFYTNCLYIPISRLVVIILAIARGKMAHKPRVEDKTSTWSSPFGCDNNQCHYL